MIPAIPALRAAALSAVAQIRMVVIDQAELAAPLQGFGTEHAFPPLCAAREEGDVILQAELAAAFLKIPAAFLTNGEAAARAAKNEGVWTKTARTEGTAAARHPVSRHNQTTAERGNRSSQPHHPVSVHDGQSDAGSKSSAAAEEGGDLPGVIERELKEKRRPGGGTPQNARRHQRPERVKQRRRELREDAKARQAQKQSDRRKGPRHGFRSSSPAECIAMVGRKTQLGRGVAGPVICGSHGCDDLNR